MRVAFFSPMPPAGSGIADYSAALAGPLSKLVELEVFDGPPARFDSAGFDIALYQIGNNPWHDFVYQTALAHPGVVVMHESNLHHLIADLTIKRGDWNAYIRELEHHGDPTAIEYGRRVRALEVGPDYHGVPMTRRLLERSRAAVVHSLQTEGDLRTQGFKGPVARIPHGAWLPDGDRMGFRRRLGLEETTPLVGIFGHLKPYKRIAESLRAFRRLVRVLPQAKLILVGEPHPELRLDSMIEQLDLDSNVRCLGYTPIDEFAGYISACDVVLNLRFPTVGESSGTLLRALGLGRAVIVSDVGSFSELPDDVCLKAPVDAAEEDTLFEYLNLMLSHPKAARAIGARARVWVERECNWGLVARRYAQFLECVAQNREWRQEKPAPPPMPRTTRVDRSYLRGWASNNGARDYLEHHIDRLEKTLQITPAGGPADRILEMGAYLQITPALKTRLGYGEVRGCYYGPAGKVDHHVVRSAGGEDFTCDVDLFDAEKDPFPYADEYFSTVLCCELIEHLVADPMQMLGEINRVLKPGGHLVLTTPNIGSLRAIVAILEGYHPGFFPAYIRPAQSGEETEARHNREYTPSEIARLVADAGFEVVQLETGPFKETPRPEQAWVISMLERYGLPGDLRGDGIYVVARKAGPVLRRYPAWLYDGGEE